jgi:hypothetical protein
MDYMRLCPASNETFLCFPWAPFDIRSLECFRGHARHRDFETDLLQGFGFLDNLFCIFIMYTNGLICLHFLRAIISYGYPMRALDLLVE